VADVTAEPVRIVIVGTGNIARSHARAIASQAGAAASTPATIVAAMDVDQSQLGTFCGEFGIPGGHGDLATLLGQARPDLVHICTPPSTHHPIAPECLRGGASVLTEKPPTISLREFDELVAAEHSAAGGEGPPWFASVFQHRFGDGQRRLKKLAVSGALGRAPDRRLPHHVVP
jgi:predicted dehydrogenase